MGSAALNIARCPKNGNDKERYHGEETKSGNPTAQRKEDYRIPVRLRSGGVEVTGIACRIFLPRNVRENPVLVFLPKKEELGFFISHPWFSLDASFSSFVGETEPDTNIRAASISLDRTETVHWSVSLEERIVVAEPLDLAVIERLQSGQQQPCTSGSFWVTPNTLVAPFLSIMRSYLGDVEVKRIARKRTSIDESTIALETHFRFEEETSGRTTSFSELVGEFQTPVGISAFEGAGCTLVKEFDDLLAVVSFVTQWPTVCRGWQATDGRLLLRYYRSTARVPSRLGKPDDRDCLVELSELWPAVERLFERFRSETPNEPIRLALFRSVPRIGETIESQFVTLYAALENLVLHYRRQANLEFIFTRQDWSSLKPAIKRRLSGLLKERQPSKERRAFVYQKIDELNRVSFGTAYREACMHYRVPIDDLWPLAEDTAAGLTLTEIRNMLVHGEVFSHAAYEGLHVAFCNLEWTLQRFLLSILGWRVVESRVSLQSLRSLRREHDWIEVRSGLTKELSSASMKWGHGQSPNRA